MASSTFPSAARTRVGVIYAFLGLVALAACSSTGAERSAAPVAPATTAASVGNVSASADLSLTAEVRQQPPAAAGTSASGSVAPAGAALAITATVTIEVNEVRETVVALPGFLIDAGAVVFGTDVMVGDERSAAATITVKVPPDDLEPLVTGLGGFGKLIGRTQQTDDVGDQIADTDARILTARASVGRVRLLLDGAVTLDDVVRIEQELTVRETALEQLLAGQRNLADRVQLATLTIVIVPGSEAVPVKDPTDKPTGIGEALQQGWSALAGAAHRVAVVAAYSAPFAVIAALLGVAGWWLRRRTRRPLRPDRSLVDSTI